MLQDIKPHFYNNNFEIKTPKRDDYVFLFNEGRCLLKTDGDLIEFPTIEDVVKVVTNIEDNLFYLFSVDNRSVFCSFCKFTEDENFKYHVPLHLRETLEEWKTFVLATADHLAKWIESNKYCGKCATLTEMSKKERALVCPNCGQIRYPNISPAVIVGIIDDDKILLTRYSDRPYKKLSLIAGFMEIGETLEDTIKREVMEEVGLRVKNIRYYKSQPWAFSQSVLMGFFAELEGCSDVKIDTTELSEAQWFLRDEMVPCETTMSLTNEMIEVFRKEEINHLALI